MRALNRLKSVAGGPAATTLAYDPFGRLDSVTAGGATTSFRYAGSQLGGEFNLSSAANYSRQLRIYLYAGGGDTPLLWLEGVTQLSTTLTQTPAWFHADRLGSVVATTNSGGAVTAYAYGPYGEPQTWAGSRFRYTGQLALPEAQLYHYRARAYDPMLGRFLQTDPIGYGDGPNIYAYVHGDPVNGTDPDGTCESCIGGPDDLRFGFWAPGASNVVGNAADAHAGMHLVLAPYNGAFANTPGDGGVAGGGRWVPWSTTPFSLAGVAIDFASAGSAVLGGVFIALIPTTMGDSPPPACLQNCSPMAGNSPDHPPPVTIPPTQPNVPNTIATTGPPSTGPGGGPSDPENNPARVTAGYLILRFIANWFGFGS